MFNFHTKHQQPVFKAFNSITSIADIVDQHLPTYGHRAAIRIDIGNTYITLDFDQYLQYLHSMIRWFQIRNLEHQIIATFCKNRVEWDMVAMATFYTANTLFPLDTKMNATELHHLLSMNPPDYILVSPAQLPRMRQLLKQLNIASVILVADLIDVFEDISVNSHELHKNEISLRQLVSEDAPEVAIVASSKLEDKDTILGHYATSGTTSLPKIVQITHGNIIAEVNEAFDVINLRNNEDLLNIGPYTHIATLVEFLVTKTRGFSVTYFTREPDDDDVLEDEIKKLKKLNVRIKVLMAVPKFWIYLLKELLEEMKNKPVLHELYKHIISIEKHQNLHDIGTLDKAKLSAMKILLRNKLGGYFSYGISSSMKLDGAIVEIFGKLGITVIDIYGATECSGIISRNRINDLKPGSCGRIISILDYRFRDKQTISGLAHQVGILEVKGPTTLHSYLGEEQGTNLSKDGYFNTGDLCWLDEQDYLYLLGRKKELLLWDDGSYIDPQHLSNLLVRSIYVKDALVTRLKPEHDYLSIYLYPDYKRIQKDPAWKKEIDTGVCEQQALRILLEQSIDYAQSIANITPILSKDKIYLLPKALERTPTHKIKFIFELQRLHLAQAI